MSDLRRITLHLARTHNFPSGSTVHGYEFVAPLNERGKIDPEMWRANRDRCTVDRFWGHEPPQGGYLVHRPGGVDGATWGFDYDPDSKDDDEVGYRFGDHKFEPGEYVSIREANGETLPFKIIDVLPV
jgi:hypothetical protein